METINIALKLNVEKNISDNVKISVTPKNRISLSSEKHTETKKRFSDRFIPTSISKDLTKEFNSKSIRNLGNYSILANSEIKNPILKSHSVKSDLNYQKILQSEFIDESTPKFDENIGTKNVLDVFQINRKLKFQTEVKKVRRIKISKENTTDSKLNLSSKEKKLKEEKCYRNFYFENISDNFYLNTLDLYDINKIGIGSKSGVTIFDGNKNQEDPNFIRFKNDSSHEIFCVKFLNSNKFIFTDSNYSLKIKDLTKELEILKFDVIQRKFLSVDFPKHNENILFLGSDNSFVDLYDLRQKNKVRNLYKHDNSNEVCKIIFSHKNNFLISGGNDNKIILFDLRKDKIIECFKHKAAVKALAYNEEENYLISGGGTFDKKLKIWDLKKFNLISECFTDSQITNLEFISNNTIAVSNGYIANNINIYKLNLDKYKNDSKILQHSVIEPVCSPDDIFTKISVFEKHSKRILYMGKSKCNQYLTSCSTDGNLKIWKLHKFSRNKAEDSFLCGIR